MKLPFNLDFDAKDCQIVGARKMCKDKQNSKSFNTWYQITVRLTDTANFEQILVAERKENDKTAHNWRIAHIERSTK